MPIITRKIELKIVKDGLTDEEYDQQWKYLYQINNTIYLAANRISTHCLFNDEYEMRLKLHMPRYKEIEKELKKLDSDKKASDKEIRDRLLNERKELDKDVKNKKKDFLQCSKQNSTYQLVSKEFLKYIPAEILTDLNQYVQNNYNNNKREVKSGERALSTYKKGMGIPFSIKPESGLRLFIKENGIYLKWFKLNNDRKEKEILFRLEFGKDASNNRCIVERLIESDKQQKKKGEDYVANNSSIKLVKNGRNTRIFLLLSIDIPAKKQVLDKDVVLGVDLGIKCPLYLAINKVTTKKRNAERYSDRIELQARLFRLKQPL